MKILVVASEVVPFAKTGGLADVTGALPRELARRGHDVRVVMPRYRSIDPAAQGLRIVFPEVWGLLARSRIEGRIYGGSLPGSNVRVYFVDSPPLFDRPELYGEDGGDYPDNPQRFAFFNMTLLWMLKGLDWAPDVIHCNDWQAAFTPVYLKTLFPFRHDPFFSRTRLLLTIHNLAYQGLFHPSHLATTGLPSSVYHAECMEYWGWVNPLKGGIAFSDHIGTVSPRYADEIQTQEYGCGLDGFIRMRRDRLTGILNGIDTDVWNPETDPCLPARYSRDDLSGKAACKAALQKRFELPGRATTPLVGMVSRLEQQKGIDLIETALPQIARLGAQFVFLGDGNPAYQDALEQAARDYPKSIRTGLAFDEDLAHLIVAGADAFLMPSNFEPCGLSQMYALKYGTLPIVRRTGGLADTVFDPKDPETAPSQANGFSFDERTPEALVATLKRAIATFRTEPALWRRLQLNGMNRDHSWAKAAGKYEQLYERMLGI
ncbi:glycogen synthase GlgA [Candidatus Sumerlaeota bacterium]|nr:glycogen synthase GlgA [Candidatus Sumerlaeota bacterium]